MTQYELHRKEDIEEACEFLRKWQRNGGVKPGYEFIEKALALLDTGKDVEVIASVQGFEDMSRKIYWEGNIAAFDYPIGTPLYATKG